MRLIGYAPVNCLQNRRNHTISSRQFKTEFVGSFYALEQLPKDDRPQIAVAGRSNVGKSSLLNRLVGMKRIAKVSSTPGKTRALNFFLIDEKFYIVDLPGYGYAKVSKSLKAQWGPLIETFLTASPNLAGLILLLDCRREPGEDDLKLLHWLSERQLPAIIVITKADKVSRSEAARKTALVENELGIPALAFSTLTGVGKDELVAAVRDLIGPKKQTLKGAS
jgi:GTP-binding protein